MAKVAKNIVRQRPQEITAACRQLYGIMSFREITIKEISARTSLSRPSIYNYFQTKEEIFLAVLQEEYDLLADGLETVIQTHEALSIDELASILGSCFGERSVMLRLLCMNLYEIEDNSRLERLAEFKRHYFSAVGKLDELLPQRRQHRFVKLARRSSGSRNLNRNIGGIDIGNKRHGQQAAAYDAENGQNDRDHRHGDRAVEKFP